MSEDYKRNRAATGTWMRVLGTLNEYQSRLFVAEKALQLGRGGISHLSQLTGMSRVTITQGLGELRTGRKLRTPLRKCAPARRRAKESGGGRSGVAAPAQGHRRRNNRRRSDESAEVDQQGDPNDCGGTDPIGTPDQQCHRWPLSGGDGVHPAANVKTREGPQHPNRDAQFRYLNRQVKAFRRVGDPVISVDTKKKELVGAFKNGGRRWLPKGMADQVSVHDFPQMGKGKAIPYGAYDIARNRAVVNVGVTHDTAEFAVESIRRWWRLDGKRHYRGRRGCSSAPTAEAVMATGRGPGS